MPLPPRPYPSFTFVMSSAPFAPFAANDNMRLPAYRTSHLARFHPYSRARPSLHKEQLTVCFYRLFCSFHAQQPQSGRGGLSFSRTSYCPGPGLIRGKGPPSFSCSYFFLITKRVGLAHNIPRRRWQSRKQVGGIHQLGRVHPQTTET